MEEINPVTAINPEIIVSEKTTDELLLESVSPLPENVKLMLIGVARGIALSASIPVAG